jgi:RimJ/RimL family protein N-acetyltransferase
MIKSKVFEKILVGMRQVGITKFLGPVINRLPRAVFERNNHVWLVRRLDVKMAEIEPAIPVTINFSRSEFDETYDWIKRNDRLWGHHEKERQVAVSTAHYWVNIKHEGKIVGFVKFGAGNAYVSDYDRTIVFPDDVVFLYEDHVARDYRRNKIASYAINETCKFCKKQGYKKVVTYVHEWNIASLRSMSNAGFERVRTIYYYKIFGVRFLTSSPSHL